MWGAFCSLCAILACEASALPSIALLNFDNGQLLFSPDKDGYELGEVVTVTPIPDEGFVVLSIEETGSATFYPTNGPFEIVMNGTKILRAIFIKSISGAAANAPELKWSFYTYDGKSSGSFPHWYSQTSDTHDGIDALGIGPLPRYAHNVLRAEIIGEGTFSFWSKVDGDTAPPNDMVFKVDGKNATGLRGDSTWSYYSVGLESGNHVVTWDASAGYYGTGYAFLDEVIFVPRPERNLTINAVLNGSINVDPSETILPVNTTVQLSAVPDAGYIFTGWTDDVSGYGNSVELIMDDDKIVGASFAPSISGSAMEAEELPWRTFGSRQSYPMGTYATWDIQTSSFVSGGSAYKSYAVFNSDISVIETYITGPGFVKFWWKKDSGGGSGQVTCSVDGGTVASLTAGFDWREEVATIPEGTHRLRWSVSASTISWTSAAYLDNVRFYPGEFVTLSLTPSSGGVLQSDPSTNVFLKGSAVSIAATPNAAYEFFDWGGAYSGWSNPMTLDMDQARTISGVFKTPFSVGAFGPTNKPWFSGGGWSVNTVDGGVVGGTGVRLGSCSLETTIIGPCSLSFDLKFMPNSSISDHGYFRVDNAEWLHVQYAQGWTGYSFDIPVGFHQLRWTFDNSVAVSPTNTKNVYLRNLEVGRHALLSNVASLGAAHFHSPTYGSFMMDSNFPWILNDQNGWQYLSQSQDSAFYDASVGKWFLPRPDAFPLVREAEDPGRWVLYDSFRKVDEEIINPPALIPSEPVMAVVAEEFPSNSFVTATASGNLVFTLWKDPSKAYELKQSMTLNYWESYSGPERVNGNVQLFEPDDIATTNGTVFIRAEISEAP